MLIQQGIQNMAPSHVWRRGMQVSKKVSVQATGFFKGGREHGESRQVQRAFGLAVAHCRWPAPIAVPRLRSTPARKKGWVQEACGTGCHDVA
jgi:hypothetical protein